MLVQKGEISAGDVFKKFFVLVSTGKVIAEAGSMTSDLAKGSAAISSVLKILDSRPSPQVSYKHPLTCPHFLYIKLNICVSLIMQ